MSNDTVMTWQERNEWNAREPRLMVSVTGPSMQRPGAYNALLVQRLCGESHIDSNKYRDGTSLLVTLHNEERPTSFPVSVIINPSDCEVLF